MSNNIRIIVSAITVVCVVVITGCYKVTTLVIPNNQEITTTVSLKDDLTPMFSKNCAISGCHNSGGQKPDLTSDKLYNSLINGGYLDLSAPENSSLYLWLTGKKGAAMPVGATNNPSNINQYVLAWIKQGAKNN